MNAIPERRARGPLQRAIDTRHRRTGAGSDAIRRPVTARRRVAIGRRSSATSG
ncbi:Hypothetical protein I596_894 [Dokdonella koreensis DS-123]|uniref:Uncharacterized protein n=1 Tax=Dokdonella koreensis DS-123 TaxID=1300342 RepID=A0A160DRT7_9GAMM|nr:Hypothetical protein I596_894 [Dokdonella koreensis DS-123]